MRFTLKKDLFETKIIEKEVNYLKLDGDSLKDYLLRTLPVLMEDTIDPEIDHTKAEVYVNNLFSNRLGDFNRRYIITIGKEKVKAILIGIRKEDHLHVLTVGVKKEYRGNKYGEEILNYCFNDMLKESYNKVILNTHSDNHPALRLYKKLGFEIIET